jgi:GNAT superfamily N-acetyltransferase
MQIREITLKELDIAYEVIKELRNLSYDEFEDLIYEMRHQEYKILGLFERGELQTYAGVCIASNLYHKKHLYIYDLVTKASARSQKFGAEMLIYLEDYAKIFQCQKIVLSSGLQRKDAHHFYEKNGFEATSFLFVKTL